ncbi:hypothetical protein CDD81_5265 [Ophiocordyceps australis]|uniref:SIS domain-containing protein n=1 Tax=Ophiocordyceps australis TaxID=1399860 RepID=A0A2C5YH22_9HYPO|nr:hypothetical protein CDD81_5265 [Ophiocordyceps australis]
MADRRQNDHRPIQTSAVIVLGTLKPPEKPPPSPPTPAILPYDGTLCQPSEAFSLGAEQQPASSPLSPTLSSSSSQEQEPSANDAAAVSRVLDEDETRRRRLERGLHVLATEARALASLAQLYETDGMARQGFNGAVNLLARTCAGGGKVVVIGVGKSGHIGRKLVATLQSLGVGAALLHPTEALHGDLGLIGARDALLFITYSGRTPELQQLLPHLDECLPAIVLTSHTRREDCELVQLLSTRRAQEQVVLLCAPIPEAELTSFGVAAPSTSTTTALALCDALAMTVAAELDSDVASRFARNHPGGAIGAAVAATSACESRAASMKHEEMQGQGGLLEHIAVPWQDMAQEHGLSHDSLGVDLLRAGYASKTGWVRIQANGETAAVAAPGRIRQLSRSELGLPLRDVAHAVVAMQDVVVLAGDMSIHGAADVVRAMMRPSPEAQGGEAAAGLEAACCGPEAVIAVAHGDSIVGLLEAGQLLERQEAAAQ